MRANATSELQVQASRSTGSKPPTMRRPPAAIGACRSNGRYGWKVTATLMITGTATPFTRVGWYSHWRTASSAA